MKKDAITIPGRARYIAPPETDAIRAQEIAAAQGLGEAILLKRRGTALGWIAAEPAASANDNDLRAAWHGSRPYVLPGHGSAAIPDYTADIEQAQRLMERVAAGESPADLLDVSPYSDRLLPRFEMLAATSDESDMQEIETIEFDAMEDEEIIGENLWCKCSWLSYEDDDDSLRFRFSFGMAGYEDVAADIERQIYAGELTEAIFPESAIISGDKRLEQKLCRALGIGKLAYVERIIYFNAPNGGAQFHQDVERGHLGVVFAQVRGRTGWLACSKSELMDEVEKFVADAKNRAILDKLLSDASALKELTSISADRAQLTLWMDDNDCNEPLELLLNRCPEFHEQLTNCGYTFIINPGDMILLPQKGINECCWHTVFCLDGFAGEALSFAIREAGK